MFSKIESYHVGFTFGQRLSLPTRLRRRFRCDRWGRLWQAEWDGCWCAPRSWTRSMVERKARRWQYARTDLKRHRRKYGVPRPELDEVAG